MKRVTGIGGIFFKAKDAPALQAWCKRHLAVDHKIDDSEYGKFAWVIDPEGNKVELWQPPAGQ
jgi:predicted enzyme related to lactoylglutathione lyase